MEIDLAFENRSTRVPIQSMSRIGCARVLLNDETGRMRAGMRKYRRMRDREIAMAGMVVAVCDHINRPCFHVLSRRPFQTNVGVH